MRGYAERQTWVLAVYQGHVWTTPLLQEESGVARAVGCKSHVSGLFVRQVPLALM